ncbi:MAG: UDP-N-acetylmuramoyl-L-alanine--D-glutamate ligase [Fretibacterium sp.]|nr:UDP-N-acetylmuramoyl-L-alanine--D-glutamate ligase [Fretibacterium sp.]
MSDSVSWSGKRITVVGAGVSGRELALLASSLGAKVFVTERKELSGEARGLFKEHGIAWEAGGHTEKAFDADVMLLSSGIPPRSEVVQEARRRGVSLMGELDFAVPQLSARVVGVTGSNGKSTVTSLIGHMLDKLGWNAGVGGNLGTAASSFTGKKLDAVVLELSSFQLAWATRLGASVSIVTNLAPDHIDWHGSYENYVAAKAKVLSLRAPGGWGIVQDRDVEALGVRDAQNIITLSWERGPIHRMAGHIFMDRERAVLTMDGQESPLFDYADTTLLGAHNLENVAMSLTALRLLEAWDGSKKPVELLKGFSPLPHRCENAGMVDGVLYVDDSKGTNVAASVTAMTCIQGRKVLILGGRGKGEDYAPLAEGVLREADAAVLLGEEADAIGKALARAGFTAVRRAKDMDEAVKIARDIARPGMTVLLSPACTSWDMYDNYGQRGDHFCSLVRALR